MTLPVTGAAPPQLRSAALIIFIFHINQRLNNGISLFYNVGVSPMV